MNKKELDLLERAYFAEINASLSKPYIRLMQTKSKIADKLVEDGLLRKKEVRLAGPWPCFVKGYELTHAGRLAYCNSCG